jgi:hypothetical protein
VADRRIVNARFYFKGEDILGLIVPEPGPERRRRDFSSSFLGSATQKKN